MLAYLQQKILPCHPGYVKKAKFEGKGRNEAIVYVHSGVVPRPPSQRAVDRNLFYVLFLISSDAGYLDPQF